jgi:hypothetical protein
MKSNSLTTRVIAVLLASLLMVPPALAQQNLGRVGGRAVVEGKPLNNITVRLRNVDNGQLVGDMRTNELGEYDFNGMPAGNYVVETIAPNGTMLGTSPRIGLVSGAMVASGVTVNTSAAAAAAVGVGGAAGAAGAAGGGAAGAGAAGAGAAGAGAAGAGAAGAGAAGAAAGAGAAGAAAGAAAAGGAFLATTAGIVTAVAVGAGITAAVVAITNDASANEGGGGQTIAALSGKITLNFADGSPSITINAGTGVITDKNGNPVRDANGNVVRNLSDLLAADKAAGGSLMTSILAKVTEIATGAGTATGTAANEATTTLAAIIKTVSAADPTAAATAVSTAVNALTKAGGGSTVVQNAITATVAAATGNTAVDQSAVRTAANSAAQANNVQYTAPTNTQNVLNQVLTTTPVAIDISAISRSN